MTKAERNAIKAAAKDLINEGVNKELAEIMAKAFFDSKLITPIVNYND